MYVFQLLILLMVGVESNFAAENAARLLKIPFGTFQQPKHTGNGTGNFAPYHHPRRFILDYEDEEENASNFKENSDPNIQIRPITKPTSRSEIGSELRRRPLLQRLYKIYIRDSPSFSVNHISQQKQPQRPKDQPQTRRDEVEYNEKTSVTEQKDLKNQMTQDSKGKTYEVKELATPEADPRNGPTAEKEADEEKTLKEILNILKNEIFGQSTNRKGRFLKFQRGNKTEVKIHIINISSQFYGEPVDPEATRKQTKGNNVRKASNDSNTNGSDEAMERNTSELESGQEDDCPNVYETSGDQLPVTPILITSQQLAQSPIFKPKPTESIPLQRGENSDGEHRSSNDNRKAKTSEDEGKSDPNKGFNSDYKTWRDRPVYGTHSYADILRRRLIKEEKARRGKQTLAEDEDEDDAIYGSKIFGKRHTNWKQALEKVLNGLRGRAESFLNSLNSENQNGDSNSDIFADSDN